MYIFIYIYIYTHIYITLQQDLVLCRSRVRLSAPQYNSDINFTQCTRCNEESSCVAGKRQRGGSLIEISIRLPKSRFSELLVGILVPNSVCYVHFLGLWSGFINPPLQSLVNQFFLQISERLFSKKKRERRSP